MFTPLIALAAAALPVLAVWAGAVDTLTKSIPNSIVAGLAASFFTFAIAAGLGQAQLFSHALCAFSILAGGFVLYSNALIGAGDAKLLGSLALWFGFENILPLLAWIALAGGLLSLICLACHAIRARFGLASERIPSIPYGAAIAAGALAVLPDWLTAL
jgi:prepilin peptidase CpaA